MGSCLVTETSSSTLMNYTAFESREYISSHAILLPDVFASKDTTCEPRKWGLMFTTRCLPSGCFRKHLLYRILARDSGVIDQKTMSGPRHFCIMATVAAAQSECQRMLENCQLSVEYIHRVCVAETL